MKRFGLGLFGQAIKAASVGAALMLSVSASHAQAVGPFAGFDGSWGGAGTVTLSNGATEHIRCKADYKVTATGMGLKQNLHCASDRLIRWPVQVCRSNCRNGDLRRISIGSRGSLKWGRRGTMSTIGSE